MSKTWHPLKPKTYNNKQKLIILFMIIIPFLSIITSGKGFDWMLEYILTTEVKWIWITSLICVIIVKD
tara:strand:+ start:316 stop:519 length:204 start_codon:yes stop_codon:yes gene_type:complete